MLKWKVDRSGFPIVWVDKIRAYLHWLPVSKVQFEYFLCAATDGRFDDKWYDRILELNPRVTSASVRPRNYWQSFLTGILPEEAQRFARWCGEDYELPALSDWFDAYEFLRDQPPVEVNWQEELPEIKPRIHKLLDQVERVSVEIAAKTKVTRTLADQMMMRHGVMEWVELQGNRQSWGGMGQLVPDWVGLLFRPDKGVPVMPREPDIERIHYFGFRLLRRAG